MVLRFRAQSAWRSFAELQKWHLNHRSYVLAEALSIRYGFLACAKAIRHNNIKYYGNMEILITVTQTKVSLVKVAFKISNDQNFPLRCVCFTPWAFQWPEGE